MTMNIVMLAVFVVSTGIHLYASLKQNVKLRAYTKPFILTSLLGFYCFSTKYINIIVVLALLFSWIGDLFLIKKGIKWFSIGGVSFAVSHFLFVLSYLNDIDFEKINPIFALFLGLIFFVIAVILFARLRVHLMKALFYPMFFYLLINATMNCFAIFRYISCLTTPTLITMIGAVLFFVSDSSLFFVRFKKDCILKTHFLVMLTYSFGEFLIVLGLIGC